MENLALDRAIITDIKTMGRTEPPRLWEIVTGLTRLYFSNPDVQALRNMIGEQDYQHLVRINQKLLES